jgi:hypothetical protein
LKNAAAVLQHFPLNKLRAFLEYKTRGWAAETSKRTHFVWIWFSLWLVQFLVLFFYKNCATGVRSLISHLKVNGRCIRTWEYLIPSNAFHWRRYTADLYDEFRSRSWSREKTLQDF